MMQRARIKNIGIPLLILIGTVGAVDEPIDPSLGKAAPNDSTVWYDIRLAGLEGQGWSDTEAPFDRFPAKAKGVERPPVWDLSRDSAGLCVRFVTDAPKIQARWTVRSESLGMPHMAATGVSGLDLYVKTDDGRWRWLSVGQPKAFPTNTATIVNNLPAARREFLLYLPLYNGVTSVEIGIPQSNMLAKAPPRGAGKNKPVVFDGTSITQGGFASRPGMVHTAIGAGGWIAL